MHPNNWDGDTTVIDPELYAIEVPVMDGGTRLCPRGTCRSRFSEDDSDIQIIQHIVQKHGESMDATKTCPICGDTFTIQRPDTDQQYCSLECYRNDGDSMAEIADDIRDELGAAGDGRALRRVTLWAIHEQLCDNITDSDARRRRLLNDLRDQYGIAEQNSHYISEKLLRTIRSEIR